jgi:HEPN domain-containing protein
VSNKNRAQDWFNQAENDYQYAQEGFKKAFYSQVCFQAQQVGEKAIKAVAFNRDYEVRGHSITKIAKIIGFNSVIEDAAKRLDLFYISARYPDAFPEGAPFEFFSKGQAQEALDDAKLLLDKAEKEFAKQ